MYQISLLIKVFTTIFFTLLVSFSLSAQEDVEFSRKGRVLIETGYNFVAGIAGGTGSSILFDSENSIITLGFNGGYFISDDLALKLGFGIFSSNGSITNITLGGKYYIIGKIPVEAGAGFLSANGFNSFLGRIHAGYTIKLA